MHIFRWFCVVCQACFRKARTVTVMNPHDVIDAVVRLLKLPQFFKDPAWCHRVLFGADDDDHHAATHPLSVSVTAATASLDDEVACLHRACAQYDHVTHASMPTAASVASRGVRVAWDGSTIHPELVACFQRVRMRV